MSSSKFDLLETPETPSESESGEDPSDQEDGRMLAEMINHDDDSTTAVLSTATTTSTEIGNIQYPLDRTDEARSLLSTAAELTNRGSITTAIQVLNQVAKPSNHIILKLGELHLM